MHLHSEEGDTCEEVHCGLEVLQPFRTAGREVILQWKEQGNTQNEPQHMISHLCLSSVSVGRSQHAPIIFTEVQPSVWVCCVSWMCSCLRGNITLINTLPLVVGVVHTKTHKEGNRLILFIKGNTVAVITVLPDTWTGLSSESCAADPKA